MVALHGNRCEPGHRVYKEVRVAPGQHPVCVLKVNSLVLLNPRECLKATIAEELEVLNNRAT